MGVLTLMASSDPEQKLIATVAAVMKAVDSLAAVRAQDMPTRTRTLAAVTTATFAVASGYFAATH